MDGAQTSQEARIKFGSSSTSSKEQVKTTDRLNVNPDWFAGVEQNDGYSCVFFVLTALSRMQKDKVVSSANQMASDEQQQKIVAAVGLDRLKKYIQEDRTQQLSISEFRQILTEIASPEAQAFTSRADLPFDQENTSPGVIAARAVQRGYGVCVELHNFGHVVFAFGVSEDGRELICWDPFSGKTDPKYPKSKLTRVAVDNPQVMMWGGLLLSDKFKNSKPKDDLNLNRNQTSQPPSSGQYTEKRANLKDRVTSFFRSL